MKSMPSSVAITTAVTTAASRILEGESKIVARHIPCRERRIPSDPTCYHCVQLAFHIAHHHAPSQLGRLVECEQAQMAVPNARSRDRNRQCARHHPQRNQGAILVKLRSGQRTRRQRRTRAIRSLCATVNAIGLPTLSGANPRGAATAEA